MINKNFFLMLAALIFVSSCNNKWNYSKNSVNSWGKNNPENKFCFIGNNQSPIDVVYNFDDNKLISNYKNIEFEKINDLYDLKLLSHGRDYVIFRGRRYYLRYIKFRHPSEHLLNSTAFTLEMQIFHKSDDEQFLAISVLLEVGDKKNSDFEKIINFLNSDDKEDFFSLEKIVNTKNKSFIYDGSFTSPPCEEGVKWHIFENPLFVSKKQIMIIINKAIFVSSNSRNIKEFNLNKY